MREITKFKIGDCEYQVKHLRAKSQRRVLRRILVAAAPLAGFQGGDGDTGGLIAKIVDGLSDDDLDVITQCFAEETKVITPQSGSVALDLSNPDLIEEHFAGPGMSAWLQWMRLCIDHNFSGFFGDLRNLVGEAVRAVAE